MIEDLLASGYLYELAGLIYFLVYLGMTRPGSRARFSQRSKVLVLVASIALVASVPLRYASQPIVIALVLALVAVSLWSSWNDRRNPPAA